MHYTKGWKAAESAPVPPKANLSLRLSKRRPGYYSSSANIRAIHGRVITKSCDIISNSRGGGRRIVFQSPLITSTLASLATVLFTRQREWESTKTTLLAMSSFWFDPRQYHLQLNLPAMHHMQKRAGSDVIRWWWRAAEKGVKADQWLKSEEKKNWRGDANITTTERKKKRRKWWSVAVGAE